MRRRGCLKTARNDKSGRRGEAKRRQKEFCLWNKRVGTSKRRTEKEEDRKRRRARNEQRATQRSQRRTRRGEGVGESNTQSVAAYLRRGEEGRIRRGRRRYPLARGSFVVAMYIYSVAAFPFFVVVGTSTIKRVLCLRSLPFLTGRRCLEPRPRERLAHRKGVPRKRQSNVGTRRGRAPRAVMKKASFFAADGRGQRTRQRGK